MSTSKHTFDQVKSILGKLDRRIDDVRARRLQPPAPEGAGAGGGGAAGPAAVGGTLRSASALPVADPKPFAPVPAKPADTPAAAPARDRPLLAKRREWRPSAPTGNE